MTIGREGRGESDNIHNDHNDLCILKQSNTYRQRNQDKIN